MLVQAYDSMQARTSIYHKLILYIFFLGIFVIVAVSLYSFITARNAIVKRTFDQLTSLRIVKKEQVTQFFNDRMKESELFAHEQDNLSGKNQIQPNTYLLPYVHESYVNQNFQRFFKSGNYYSHIYLITDGTIKWFTFDSLPNSQKSIGQDTRAMLSSLFLRVINEKKVILEDYSAKLRDSLVHLCIASPVYNGKNSVIGCAIFLLNPDAVSLIMKNSEVEQSLGTSGEVYLVGADSLMRSESRFYKRSILSLPVKTQSVRNAFSNIEGTHLIKDYRGILTLSSYSLLGIPGLNWVIIAEIDKKEAMRPVYKLANEIVFLSIFITLFLFVAAYIISRTIAGPIIELKNATIEVGKGEFDHSLSIKSNDELGELTENFNLMTSQLKAQKLELKRREVWMFSSFIDGQEDERQRLSRELHDGLGQMIVATKLKTESMVNSEKGITLNNISKLRLMFDSLVDEVRSISNNLMPAVLQEFGLEMALEQICREISNNSKIKVVFDSQISDQKIDKRIAVYLFRIAQEAINNAVKHANATEIIMTLIGNDKMINLMVQDDGIGINLEEPCNHLGRGINNMCERVKLLDGLIDISKGVNHGTIVSVKIPLNS